MSGLQGIAQVNEKLTEEIQLTESCDVLQSGLSPALAGEGEVELELVRKRVGGVGVAKPLNWSEVDHVVARPTQQ